MRNITRTLAIAVIATTLLSSCSVRLLDFTVISSKNVSIKPQGNEKRVVGRSMGVFNFGVNLKEAIDKAIEKAGPGYDALIDGVLYQKSYYFYGGFEVQGTPIKTSAIKASMTDEEFEKYCLEHNLMQSSERN
jgi:hypothetical protein